MSWLNFSNHFLSNQRLRAWSWINSTFSGMVFWWGIWLWMFGPFPFLFFFLVRGDKFASAQDFGLQSKEMDHFNSWFSFFSCLLVTILYYSDIVWSKDFSVYFVFFRSLIGNFSFFFFCFLPILIGNFLFLLSSDLWLRIFFLFFLPIFDRELSFFFFCFLPRARMDILTLGQGLWWVGILAQGS